MSTRRCLDCPTLINAGSRCGVCALKRSRADHAKRGGNGYTMQEIAAKVIVRDGGCVDRPPHRGRLEADHVVPVEEGGETSMENMVCRCMAHNRRRQRKAKR